MRRRERSQMRIVLDHPSNEPSPLQRRHRRDLERVESGRIRFFFDHVRRPAELMLENANGGAPCIFIYFVAPSGTPRM